MLAWKNTSECDRSDLREKNHIEIKCLKTRMRQMKADEKRNRNL